MHLGLSLFGYRRHRTSRGWCLFGYRGRRTFRRFRLFVDLWRRTHRGLRLLLDRGRILRPGGRGGCGGRLHGTILRPGRALSKCRRRTGAHGRGDRMNLFGVDRLHLHTRGRHVLAIGLTAQRLQLRWLYRGARVLLQYLLFRGKRNRAHWSKLAGSNDTGPAIYAMRATREGGSASCATAVPEAPGSAARSDKYKRIFFI